ncbi:MAG: hypothetical protein P8Y24_12210 [Gammaproteobacteria bacterium]
MDAKEFVKNLKKEKDDMFELYTSNNGETEVSALINKLDLNSEQKEKLKPVIDTLLTDTYYSILLGLDGSGSLGGIQQTYKIYDEDNNLISDCGEIEAEAWEQFHGSE